jgi:hypothetical protein
LVDPRRPEVTKELPGLNDLTRDPGLSIYRQGLRHIVVLNVRTGPPAPLTLEGGLELPLNDPDLVAFRLPKDYQGVTFQTGSMFDPAPMSDLDPFVLYSLKDGAVTGVRIKYDVPEPDWYAQIVPIFEKVVPFLTGFLVLAATKRGNLEHIPIAWNRVM